MGQIKLYGRRTVSQFTSGNPTAAQYSHISVYNDSTIGHILRVRSYSVAPGAGAYVLGFLNQGSLGTLVAAGIPIFAGEGTLAGSLYSGSNTTQPTTGQLLGQLSSSTIYPIDFPLAYLRPGWSWVMQCRTVNTAMNGSILWEDLTPEMLHADELA